MSIEELRRRVTDCEDSLTERKSTGSFHEIIRTVVAFANSVPDNRTGVLYIGVSNNGDIIGVNNPEKLQKTVRNICENECYPPIWANIVALPFDAKTIISVEVPYSKDKPYFSGHAFVRRGSETRKVSDELLNELIFHRIDKCRYILKHKDTVWRVEAIAKHLGDSIDLSDSRYREAADCRIEEVTPHFVRFKNISNNSYFTEELNFINISWDEGRNRPKIVVRYKVSISV